MAEFEGYLRDLETGAIIGVSRKNTLIHYENENKNLIKSGEKHLIRFEVMSSDEGIEEYNDNILEIPKKVINPVIKKSGRPAKV